MLMARLGWRPFFIALGLASLLWLIPWVRWMPEMQASASLGNDTSGAPSLAEFLRLRSAWGCCLGHFCGNYVNYFLITWLPFYLVRERHLSMDTMAQVGGTAYLLSAGISLLSGWLSDRWITSGATPTRVRKTFTAGGIALSGVCLGLSAIGGPFVGLIMLGLGVIFYGISSSNLWAIPQILAGPRAVGRWTGFQNMVANLAGVAAPAITGFVVQRTGHFYWAFAVLTCIALTGAVSWIFIVGPLEQQVWHKRMTGKVAAV